ncbi:MAG: hypothetical protein EB141_13735, partial [Verrucomicrobia bacterium]|nr:hypothetical protein [Verrucomicrobiota bacterium]
TGPNPVEAARRAAQRGVRVYTVGFGSPNGTLTTFDGFSMRVQLDEEVLKEIADITRGAYFRAETSSLPGKSAGTGSVTAPVAAPKSAARRSVKPVSSTPARKSVARARV